MYTYYVTMYIYICVYIYVQVIRRLVGLSGQIFHGVANARLSQAQQSENAAGKGGFQKYMDYAKYTQGHGSQGGDYKQYMDYSKYAQGHGSQGSDYKQYMQSYAGDYSKYTQGHGSQAR